MTAWHVALLTSGTEKDVLVGLKDVGIAAIWPRWVEKSVSRGQVVERTRSLAPGYMFVEFDGSDASSWHDVRDVCGESFRAFIGGEFPTPVPLAAMDRFLDGCQTADGLMSAPQNERPTGRVFRPGERVALSGLLDATEGTVVWSDARGVRITVNLFARSVEMWVPRGSEVLKATDNPQKSRSQRRRRRVRGKTRRTNIEQATA